MTSTPLAPSKILALRPEPLFCVFGGLERDPSWTVVREWLGAEAECGRSARLACPEFAFCCRPRPEGLDPRIELIERSDSISSEAFLGGLALEWRKIHPGLPVHARDLSDASLRALFDAGSTVVPAFHDGAALARSKPASWPPLQVLSAQIPPGLLGEASAAAPAVFWKELLHRPQFPTRPNDALAAESLRRIWNLPEEAVVILAVGDFVPENDHRRAVKTLGALARMIQPHRTPILVILGSADPNPACFAEFLSAAAAEGVERLIRLPGPQHALGPWLSCADIFLRCARGFDLPLAALQALAAGIPVAAPDAPALRQAEAPSLRLFAADADPRTVAAAVCALPDKPEDARLPSASAPATRAPRVASLLNGLQTRRDDDPIPDLRLGGALFATGPILHGGHSRRLAEILRTASAARYFLRHALFVAGASQESGSLDALSKLETPQIHSASIDAFVAAEALVASAARSGCGCVCFWGLDPKIKILAASALPPSVRIVDALPGPDALFEVAEEHGMLRACLASAESYAQRLSGLLFFAEPGPLPEWASGTSKIIIPPGAEWPDAPTPEPAASAPRFLVRGSLRPGPDSESLFEAFDRLRKIIPAAELRVCSEGGVVDLLRASAPDGVQFRGPDPDFASRSEPWSAVIVLGRHPSLSQSAIEAMASGIPVIASDSAAREAFEASRDKPPGFLLSENPSPSALFIAMKELSEMANRSKFRVAGRDLARRRYGLAEMARSCSDELAKIARDLGDDLLERHPRH